MTRDEMIDYLEEDDFQYIMDSGAEMLRTILQYGFRGYFDYTDQELKLEVNERKALKGEIVDDLVEFINSKEIAA